MEDQRPKRQLTEAQLKALAEGRKRSLEVRKKRGEITKTIKQEAKDKLEKTYNEVVTKRKVRAMKEKLGKVEIVDEQEPTDDEEEVLQKQPPRRREVAPPQQMQQPQQEPNFKQLYYKAKLEKLTHAERQQQDLYNYSQAPLQTHAYDVAKQNLVKSANEEVYKYAYRNIFPQD